MLIYSKGGKTRAIKLLGRCGRNCDRCEVMRRLANLYFTSRKKKGHLKELQVNRIVKAAAKRVPGLEESIA